MIEPIGPERRADVVARSHHCLELAEVHFERRFPAIPVRFDLRGSCAGMFRLKNNAGELRFNPWLFAKYYEDSLANTVPHEVAHYVVHVLFGTGRVRPHGREWRAVMALFGADPAVTGRYDLEGIPHRRQRRFKYRCACQVHRVSTRRHNSIQRDECRLVCRDCRGELNWCGEAPTG